MAYIKLSIQENNINEKVNIVTHNLLKSYNLEEHIKNNTVFIDLPCPLDEITFEVCNVNMPVLLEEKFIINIERCPRCKKVAIGRKCKCYMYNDKLKINCFYYKDESLIRGSKETLDILLKCIHMVYSSTMKKEIKEVEIINRPINDCEPCEKQKDHMIRKELKKRVIGKLNKGLLDKFKGRIAESFMSFTLAVQDIFKFGLDLFRPQIKRTSLLPKLTTKEVKENMEADYLLFIYQHIDLILDYGNSESRRLLRIALGLQTRSLPKDIYQEYETKSFENGIYNKEDRILCLSVEESFHKLQNVNNVIYKRGSDGNLLQKQPFNVNDKIFFAKFERKLMLINFIKAINNSVQTKSINETQNRLNSLKDRLQTTYIDDSIHKIRGNNFITISSECPFTNDKLIGISFDKLIIYKSKTKPIIFECLNESGILKKYLYKQGADLSYDKFFNSLTKYIYRILNLEGSFYNVLPLSTTSGLIEIIEGKTISSLLTPEDLTKEITHSSDNYCSITKKEFILEKVKVFLKSLSAMILMNYLFEIRDRTPDNILINNNGQLFNIDYEYSLGKNPKILSSEIEIPCRISEYITANQLLKEGLLSLISGHFKTIRRNHQKILIASRIFARNDLSPADKNKAENIFVSKLYLDLDEDSSVRKFLKVVNRSLNNYKTKINEIVSHINKTIS